MQGRVGWNQLQWQVPALITLNVMLSFEHAVCQRDDACIGFPLAGGISSLDTEEIDITNMTCYKGGETVFNNHQMCNVTSKCFSYDSCLVLEYFTPADRKILDMLPGRPPQVTFSCDRMSSTCDFQFWAATVESFYCFLEDCTSETQPGYDANTTIYACERIKCACIPGRFICGEDGSVGKSLFC